MQIEETPEFAQVVGKLYRMVQEMSGEIKALRSEVRELREKVLIPDESDQWLKPDALIAHPWIKGQGFKRKHTLNDWVRCGILRVQESAEDTTAPVRNVSSGNTPRYEYHLARTLEAIAYYKNLSPVERRAYLPD